MAEIHYFDINIAKHYGVNSAIILQNIWHWIKKNEANGKNFYDGYYWTYNSTKAFKELFPYFSGKQIETALKKLRDEGLLITGNYNENKYDRTLWYAITEKGKSILQSGEMEIPLKGNGFDTEGKPIPYINTYINENVNTIINKRNNKEKNSTGEKNAELENKIAQVIDHLNKKANTNYRYTSKNTVKVLKSLLTGKNPYTVEDCITVIDKQCAKWIGTDFEQYLRPDTLFGNKFEGYLNSKVKSKANNKTTVDDLMNQEALEKKWNLQGVTRLGRE